MLFNFFSIVTRKAILHTTLKKGFLLLCMSLFSMHTTYLIAQSCTKFNVVGGGQICQGSYLFLGLQGSELNVTYELYRNGFSTGITKTASVEGEFFTWQITQAGTYTVEADCGETMNGSAVYTILTPTEVHIQGTTTEPLVICLGESITFTATGGSDYKWYYDNIQVGTGVSYTPDSVQEGIYTLTGNNSCGSPSSDDVELEITPNVSPPQAPAGTITRCKGAGTSQYTIGSTANAESYSWEILNAANSTISSNGTSATVTWDGNFTGIGTVKVTANGCGGSAESSSTNVTVLNPTSPNVSSPSGYVGETFKFLAQTNDPNVTGVVEHEWFSDAAGTTQVSFQTESADPLITSVSRTLNTNDPSSFWVRTKYTENSTTCYSNLVEVAANIYSTPNLYPGYDLELSILSSTSPGDLDPGQPSGSPDDTYTYQWQVFNGTNPVDISGATNATYNPGNLTNDQIYYRKVTVTYGSNNQLSLSASDTVEITVHPALNPGEIDQNDFSICLGQTPTLTASSPQGGDPSSSYSYQWEHSANETTGFTEISNATGSSYTLPSSGQDLFDKPYYRRRVSLVDGCCSSIEYTESVKVTVETISASVTPVGPVEICPEVSITLSASPTGLGYTYQWKLNGSDIVNATTSTYQATAAGNYSVEITNASCGDISNVVAISVEDILTNFEILSDESNNLYCKDPGEGTVLYVEPLTNTSYQWKRNGSNVGSDSPIYTATQTGNYTLTITQNSCSATSASFEVINEATDPSNQNYIRVFNAQQTGVVESVTLAGNPNAGQVQIATTYVDGLGRNIQTVNRRISPDSKDMVIPVVYDPFGRQPKQYLPYLSGSNDGLYQTCPIDDEEDFYLNNSGDIANSAYAFSSTVFENSPLNRVIKEIGPGDAWHNSDKSIEYNYRTNTSGDNVRLWRFEISGSTHRIVSNTTGYERFYPIGSLFVIETTDENGNMVTEYKNKQDQIVLKKVEAGGGDLLTYYIYDDRNQLRVVIPPMGSQALDVNNNSNISANFTDDELKNWCFMYKYDDRNRMTEKKVPGAEPMYMVYDKRDRLVLTQDGNLRNDDAWLYTKYDDLNRPITTGIYYPGQTFTQVGMQGEVNSFVAVHGGQNNASYPVSTEFVVEGTDLQVDTYRGETGFKASNSITIQGGFSFEPRKDKELSFGVGSSGGGSGQPDNTGNAFPGSGKCLPLTITYYDDYSFDSDNAYEHENVLGVNPTPYTRNLVTGAQVRVLGTDTWLTTANYYDEKGRVVQTVADNYVGGKDIVSNQYNYITGQLLKSQRNHGSDVEHGSENERVITQYEYDHAQRLTRVYHTAPEVSESNKIWLVENEYNELGELVDKSLYSDNGGSTFAQSVDYRYNIRGWLTHINNSNLTVETGINDESTDYFGMELVYENTLTGGNTTGFNQQYNGNIAGVQWKTQNVDEEMRYIYNYDKMNRLTKALYSNITSSSKNGWYDVTGPTGGNIQYDLNGNIQRLLRYSSYQGSKTKMDDLSYTYTNGNQLATVDENATSDIKTYGFKDGINMGNDYTYDDNGNLVNDWNKDIVDNIQYNHLNLPEEIIFDQKGKIRYIYDATGNKLRKEVTSEGKTLVTDYVAGIQYEDAGDGQGAHLDFIMHEEGRLKRKEEGDYVYRYDIKDHLGNNRITFTTETEVDTYVATMETEEDGYENNIFGKIAETRQIDAMFNATLPTTEIPLPKAAARLNAADDHIIGPNKSLAVQPGDHIVLEVTVKYVEPSSTNTLTAASVLDAVVDAFTATAGIDAQMLHDVLNVGGALLNAGLQDDPDGNGVPRAYLNYILFNTNYEFKNMGAFPISSSAESNFEVLQGEVTVTEPGYMYVYVSNESKWDVNVFFDDLTIEHEHSKIIQQEDFYPFGLTFNQTPGRDLNNKYLYNSFELQDDLGLGWYDYQARYYDPALGRFNSVDPAADLMRRFSTYSYAFDNPIRFIDPDGMIPEETNDPPGWQLGVLWRKVGEEIDQLKSGFDNTVNNIQTSVGEAVDAIGEFVNNTLESGDTSVDKLRVEENLGTDEGQGGLKIYKDGGKNYPGEEPGAKSNSIDVEAIDMPRLAYPKDMSSGAKVIKDRAGNLAKGLEVGAKLIEEMSNGSSGNSTSVPTNPTPDTIRTDSLSWSTTGKFAGFRHTIVIGNDTIKPVQIITINPLTGK